MSLPVLIVIALVLGVAAWALFRAANRPAGAPPARPAAPASETEVLALVRQGNPIQAIKLLRESRGLDLKTAKEAVDELVRTGALPPMGPGTVVRVLQQDAVEELHALVRAGRQIDAIKRYRELTGADLKESKDAIDALARDA